MTIPGSGWRAGVYAQDEWAIAETLNATAGLRMDAKDGSHRVFSPRVGLIWSAGPATAWKALYGRAHRAPNVFERELDYVSQAPNLSLKGEKVDTLELVADHRVGSDLALRASAYAWNMQDLVTLGTDPVSDRPQYQNGAAIEARGVELSAAKTWVRDGSARGSVSYQRPRYADGSALANSPQWLGKLDYARPLGASGAHLGYQLQYASKRLAIDGTGLRGYWLSSVNVVADRWIENVELSLGVHNLFAASYQHPGSRNNWQNALQQDGRSVRAKLGYRF